MNDQIKRLAEQAHEDVRSDEEANGVCFKDYHLQFQKAFARLLILECANFTDPVTRKLMMKHFGVEE
jgi:hypothetical protein